MTRARPKPPDADPPPVDRERVRRLLGLANDLRESGVSLHYHQIMTELAEASGNTLAIYVFTAIPDDVPLDDDRLDAFADGLTGVHPCDTPMRLSPWSGSGRGGGCLLEYPPEILGRVAKQSSVSPAPSGGASRH